MESPARPVSAVSQIGAWTALALAIAVFFLARHWQWAPHTALVLICAAVATPFLVAELPQLFFEGQRAWQPDLRRVAMKLVGLAGLVAGVAAAYIVFRGFAADYVLQLLPGDYRWYVLLAAIALAYLLVADAVLPEKQEELWEIGNGLLHPFVASLSGRAKQYVLGWVLKAFFAPLMLTFTLNDLRHLLPLDLGAALAEPAKTLDLAVDSLYLIDVTFGGIGYVATFKLFNTHIRTIQTTLLGWVICLVCYPPFWPAIRQSFLNYEDSYGWGQWLWNAPVLWWLWGSVVVFFVAVYAWATVSFGIRFSNLTNRGIITNGPYRFVKHPAYISKCASFWMISIPFIPHESGSMALANCVALAIGNGIYVVRARTEEAQLMQDADYRAYAAWISENGLFARLRRAVPGMKNKGAV